MTSLFLHILDRSLCASWIVLALIAARLLLKKAPRWLLCSAWALVALRLICPFSLESTLSLIPRQTAVQEAAQELMDDYVGPTHTYFDTTPEYAIARDAGLPTFPAGEESHHYVVTGEPPATPPVTLGDRLPGIGCCLWLAGVAGMLGYAILSYRRILRKTAASIHLGNGIYLCDYIDTPFILGIRKPRIYLPSEMAPGDAGHVLAHERAHLARKDHWWKPLGYLLLTIHWFNPLLWIAYLLLCRDIELACDERVIRDLALPEKKAYSEALLKCSVPRHMIAACPLAFGEVGVKQRVKSVLHYKKPRFWILLISILLIVAVAVCFLTDPKGHTVANLLDLNTTEITRIQVWSKTSRTTFETKDKIDAFLEFLDTLDYDPTPAASEPITDAADENNWSYQTIDISCEGQEIHVLFNYDYSLVWVREENGSISLPYSVKNSQLLQNYMDDHLTPVVNREASAKPFATADQPDQWLRGICPEALQSAYFRTESTHYLSNAQTEALTDILNNIPETSLGNQRNDEDFRFDPRIQSMPFFLLRDDTNNLTAILTCFNDSIALSLVRSSDYDRNSWDSKQYSARICTLDSQPLRNFFAQMHRDPPDLLASSGSGFYFREELEVISDGEFTMSFHPLENWDYEIIPPGENDSFFGFRCRPKKESEGWVTFGWWEDWSPPADTEQPRQSNLYGYHYRYTSGQEPHTYSRAYCFHGDFVTTYENTSAWATRYQEDLSWLPFFVNVTCEPAHTWTTFSEDVRKDLVNAAYFHWDSIAQELGTEHLILFDPQYYEDYLFVGLSHDDDYHIACFRQTDIWEYEFLEILEPVSKFLPRDKTQAVPVAEFAQEGSAWQLYVFDDEAITGVHCHSGFGGYFPVQGTPSLFLLDTALWEDGKPLFDLRYDDPPLLYFFAQSNGSKFEFNTSPQYYLYDCLVNFNDGENPPGTYSLETEELKELAKILLSLPELTENVIPDSDFSLSSHTPSIYLQLYLDDNHLYMWGENGVQRPKWGNIRLELFYSAGSITLGVNMEDLDNDFYSDRYYFKVESPELEAFLLDKCDTSRSLHTLSVK